MKTTRLIYVSLALLMAGTGELVSQTIGEIAPDFEVDIVESDENYILSDQIGKVVFIFFFGNGCPYCISAGPDIESSIYQAFIQNPNFTAIGIDTWNSSSSVNSVNGFRNSTGITFPLALKGGEVASTYQTTYDRLMVVNREGILVHKGIVGAGSDINNVVEAINEALIASQVGNHSDKALFELYPNPVSDILHFSTDGAVEGISICQITGEVVMHVDLRNNAGSSDVEISLKHLEQGIYFYTIQKAGDPVTGKIMVLH